MKFLQTSKSIYESNLGNGLKGYNATYIVLKWIIVDWHLYYLLREKKAGGKSNGVIKHGGEKSQRDSQPE